MPYRMMLAVNVYTGTARPGQAPGPLDEIEGQGRYGSGKRRNGRQSPGTD